jgi:hypothetical protein
MMEATRRFFDFRAPALRAETAAASMRMMIAQPWPVIMRGMQELSVLGCVGRATTPPSPFHRRRWNNFAGAAESDARQPFVVSADSESPPNSERPVE